MSIVVNKTRLPVTEWQTASGSVVSISDARKRYAKSLSVALEPIQDLSHGDPSPTNLCPISGHSSVTLNHAGTSQSDNPTSITVQLGQTVYGGTVDLVSGVGTVIWTDIDMGTMKWERYGDKFYSTSIRSVIHKGSASYGYGNILSSQYKNVSKSSLVQLNDGEISVDSGGNIQLCDNRFSDSASLKTALDGVQLVYPLATPQTIQLTANQIEMLMRNNTVWSDAGVVTLNYARIHS